MNILNDPLLFIDGETGHFFQRRYDKIQKKY